MGLYNTGIFYRDGTGVKQDWVLAVRFFEKSAAQAYGPALTALGELYCEGNGVSRDYMQAAELLSEAADLGESGAMYDPAPLLRGKRRAEGH